MLQCDRRRPARQSTDGAYDLRYRRPDHIQNIQLPETQRQCVVLDEI